LIGATLLSAVALAACGGSSTGLIPATNAGVLSDNLSSLSSELSMHNCAGVDAALGRIEIDIFNLPASVDRRLRSNLDAGYNDLDNVARTQCQAPAKPHHVSNGNTGQTGTTHATGSTQTTTGSTQTTTGSTQTTTGPTQTTTGPTGSTNPTVGPGGGAQAPTGATGTTGSTLGGTAGF
jgi:hypothetical protein